MVRLPGCADDDNRVVMNRPGVDWHESLEGAGLDSVDLICAATVGARVVSGSR